MKSVLVDFFGGSLYKQFEDFLKIKYPDEYQSFTEKEKLDKFENIFMIGLRQAKKFLAMKMSCDLLYKDKPPRADMVQKLGHILFELQKIPSFPVVPPLSLRAAIKKIIISGDKRYINKYQDWILSHSNHQRIFNKVDMESLVKRFPDDKIVEMGFW